MSVHELRSRMREAGFRVSLKARKIDNSLAKEIIKKLSGVPAVEVSAKSTKPIKIEIPSYITVKDFAFKLQEPVTAVIKKLIENGVMATINEEIDSETAAIIGSEFGVEVFEKKTDAPEGKFGLGYVYEILAKEDPAKLTPRPPIVAVMGHVDHGKTTLLDTIRKTNVVATESGAITQHIGAYQVEHKGKHVTFLDTPGHEAFTAMRARGANVTDIIVLVVAADDSVKPQTVEVINRAKLTKTPLVVALNKIDKPEANPERVKSDLAALGVTPEDWGGKVPVVPISAKQGKGLDELLETILLTAELEEPKANPNGQTLGTIIDSRLSRGQGAVATALVQNGTLKSGDVVVVGTTYGRIRSLEDATGKKLKTVSPGMPAAIAGLSDVPEVGDILRTVGGLEEARREAYNLQKLERVKRLESRPIISTVPNQRELRVMIRADVQGSLEALQDILSKLGSEEVKLVTVDSGVGEITESDIQLAENTKSVILGFRVRMSPAVVKLAKLKNVTIDTYDIIYELVEDVTSALLSMMPLEVVRVNLGRAKIKAIFRTEKKSMIIGGEVIEGKIVDKKKFKIIRDGQEVGEGKIEELQQSKTEVDEVQQGKEFGLKCQISTVIQTGDILQVFDETVKKKEMK